eukprot:gene1018-12707_t
MADTFARSVAAKDVQLLALEEKVQRSEKAIADAICDGGTPEARSKLFEAHFEQGQELKEARES